MPRKKKPAPPTSSAVEPADRAGPTAAAEADAGGTVYRGRRTPNAVVTVEAGGAERPLPLRLDLARHSPTGFGWGYAGSGPAQLALALAADALGDDDRAKAVHQRLKAAVVAGLPHDGWALTADAVRAAVAAAEHGRGTVPADPTDEPTGRPAAELPVRAARTVVVRPPEADPDPADDFSGDHEPGDRAHAAAVRADGLRVPNPFGFRHDAVAGVRLLEDRRFKQLQLRFVAKPSEAVRAVVAEAGWRWRPQEEHWTKQIDAEKGWQTRADADALYERVVTTIRAEMGVTAERG